METFLKKYLVGLKNDCTFAPAFEKKKQELFETDEKKEIACVNPYIKVWGGHEDESKGKTNNVSEEREQWKFTYIAEPRKRLVEDKILTMKSLILAQDER